jgi:serine/threonine protein kinase
MWNDEITLLNKYVHICRLGAGQFGTVYKSLSLKNNSYYAVKICSSNTLKHESTILHYLFTRNPLLHVPQLIWYGVHPKLNACMIMTYYDGGSLLDCKDTMTEQEKLQWWNDMLSLVKHLHSLEIIHRDLKPSHFMRNQRNQWFLIDFGLATVLSLEREPTDSIVGSSNYTSYYVHDGWKNNARDDLLSLLYVFWELVRDDFPCTCEVSDWESDFDSIKNYSPEHILHPYNQWAKKKKEKTYLLSLLEKKTETLFSSYLKEFLLSCN